MDTCGKPELIHAKSRDFRETVYLLDWKPIFLVIHNNFTNRTLAIVTMVQISALSTFDGSIEDYHGDNGYGKLGFDSGEGA